MYSTSGVLQSPQFQFPQTAPAAQSSVYGGGSLEQANDPRFRDPQAAQWNITIERQLEGSTVARISYVGMNSYRLPVTVDLNQIASGTTPYSVPEGKFVDARAPYQNWFLLMSSENLGFSNYQALQAQVTHSLAHGLSLQANYTFAKNISDAQGSDAPTAFAAEEAYAAEIANRFDVAADRGNVVGTPRQRFLFTGIYQLPFGSGRHWLHSGWLSTIFGGWNLSAITTLQTAQWLTPTTTRPVPIRMIRAISTINRTRISRTERVLRSARTASVTRYRRIRRRISSSIFARLPQRRRAPDDSAAAAWAF